MPGECRNWIKRTHSEFQRLLLSRGGWPTLKTQILQAWQQDRKGAVLTAWVWMKSAGSICPAMGSAGSDRNDYTAWRERCLPSLPIDPTIKPTITISVVMPLYKPPMHLLHLALASVRQQSYPHWELCLADDASADEALRQYLQNLCDADPRIKVSYRSQNGHISACSNTALELATGDFVLLLDQDDVLVEGALALVAQTLAMHPNAQVLFSDEDRMDETGQHFFGPYFKSGYNYDLLLGQNMVSHLGVYRRQLLKDIGGFRLGYEGSQDYDLALRSIERIDPSQVVHVPHVLYHWRAIKGSAALDTTEKSYTVDASRRAVQDHLSRTHQQAEVEVCPDLAMFHRVKYALPEAKPLVSVIVNVPNMGPDMGALLDRLDQSKGAVDCEWLTCDSAGHLNPVEQAQAALAQAKGNFVCWVNAGFTDVSPNWLEELVRVASQPRCGFVAPRVRNAADLLDHGGVVLTRSDTAVYAHRGQLKGATGSAGRAILQQAFGGLSHAVLVVEKAKLDRMGGFDPTWPMPLAVLDACWRWSAHGLQHIWTPHADLKFERAEDAGLGNLLAPDAFGGVVAQRWQAQWGRSYRESYYNPHLSASGDFSFNWTPTAP